MDATLFERLREWRSATAKEQGVPAFVVLHDSTLEAICLRRPRSRNELLLVPGIGERKAERYGVQIRLFWRMHMSRSEGRPFQKRPHPIRRMA